MTGVGRVAAVVVLGAMLTMLLAGCGTATRPTPPVAQPIDGVDCLAPNLRYLSGAPFVPEGGGHSPVPLAGSIPEDFQPVRVVLCHVEEMFGQVAVIQEMRSGNLDELLEALATPSAAPRGMSCPAAVGDPPELWLVDRAGEAARMAWPVDGCGRTQAPARMALSGLAVLDDRLLPLTRNRPLR